MEKVRDFELTFEPVNEEVYSVKKHNYLTRCIGWDVLIEVDVVQLAYNKQDARAVLYQLEKGLEPIATTYDVQWFYEYSTTDRLVLATYFSCEMLRTQGVSPSAIKSQIKRQVHQLKQALQTDIKNLKKTA